MIVREIGARDSELLSAFETSDVSEVRRYHQAMAYGKAYDRFISSMTITQEMWHDGIGYETDALAEMTAEELAELVKRMKECGDWRDVEALSLIAAIEHEKPASAAKVTLKERAKSKDKIGLRAAAALRDMGETGAGDLEDSVVETLLRMGDGSAFSEALDRSEEFPTPRVKLALLKCARDHSTMGVHCAAMLYFHAGLAKESFDWDHRPFFLRFNAEDEEDRARAFKELCAKVRVDLTTVK